jgi:S-DNA-T family DNA segregation ATPase FtsK/SpoIIIE
MVWQLALQNDPEDLKFILFDPKRDKFSVFSRLPHLIMPVLHTARRSFSALGWLMKELDRRLKEEESTPAIVFVVDELIELMRVDERIAGGALGRLAQLGRERGIHLILATQRPDRRYMDRLAAANLGLRLVGRVADAVEANVACGIGGTGAHKLCDAGDFLGIVSGSVQRIAIALVSDDDLAFNVFQRDLGSGASITTSPHCLEIRQETAPILSAISSSSFRVADRSLGLFKLMTNVNNLGLPITFTPLAR